MTPEVPHGYRLVESAPGVDEYLALRQRAGLSPKTREQAVAALPGSWAACHVVHEASGQTVGMGRVLGDGGWYFHIVDMAVLPDHQRRGLGDAILRSLLRPDPRRRAAGRLRQPPRRPARPPPLRPPRLRRDRPALGRHGAATRALNGRKPRGHGALHLTSIHAEGAGSRPRLPLLFVSRGRRCAGVAHVVSALAFMTSNSDCVMVPASSSVCAVWISLAGPPVPAASRTC